MSFNSTMDKLMFSWLALLLVVVPDVVSLFPLLREFIVESCEVELLVEMLIISLKEQLDAIKQEAINDVISNGLNFFFILSSLGALYYIINYQLV